MPPFRIAGAPGPSANGRPVAVGPLLPDVLREHGAGLRRLTARYAAGEADRDDLFQEISIALWRALPAYRGEASVRTFVYRVARNRGASWRLRQRRRGAHEIGFADGAAADAVPAPDADPLRAAEDRQRADRLQRSLARLRPGLRETLLLRLDGCSDREIAERLGITANNASVRLFRARSTLRRLLDPGDFDV